MFFPYVFDLNTAQNDVWYCTMYIIRLGCLVLYTIPPLPSPPTPTPLLIEKFRPLASWEIISSLNFSPVEQSQHVRYTADRSVIII